ncbi:hypothetical protein YH65_01505 [Sulfurovum lithotrophicum]|uniref:Capsule biosynthesis protein n=2 Tax=Sulfurovum lithotrophicum TaxID=206403 RepID=A0A7U4M301_9BACT|nr:hypothetical protein YH65_01505 [Sulfurovum lithotrophicum]
MGTFFKKLDKNFRKKGAITYRIGFNMGDQFFSYRDNYIPFRDVCEVWPKFIEEFLGKKKIDMVFLFGDCRYYQKVTTAIAKEKGIDVFVFEEGYLRPHYITMEKFGVNGFSQLSKNPAFYLSSTGDEMVPEPVHAKSSKTKMVISATLYYAISNLFGIHYPHYRHHREFSAVQEAFYGIRGLFRKALYAVTERDCLERLTVTLSGRYYFVPLQTHNDFQILQHSRYRSIEKFIIEVLESFAQYAPKDTYLVFKHHPVDRGRKNYRKFILEQANILEIRESVIVIHDVFLPEILKHTRGTVTINSTVGLTSIEYGIPTITLGEAVYDIEGLTNKGKELKVFWSDPQLPDRKLYHRFRQYLVNHTQLNGSFYGRMPKELQ